MAGGLGYDSSNLDSTETLVEGGQSWTLGEKLPSRRRGLRGVSLLDTVIMTGNKVLTLSYFDQTYSNQIANFF